MSSQPLSIAAKVPVTEAEGPGKRFAIWVQGCPFRCPGCCNPHYLNFKSESATQVAPDDLSAEILAVKNQIEGVTFIGGEPFAQPRGLAQVAEAVQKAGLSVMIFSGFTLEELSAPNHPDYTCRKKLLAHTDLLIDGQYQREHHVTDRRWIGSSNQEPHFLTERYKNLKEQWPSQPNTIEIRYTNGELTINGFPHRDITKEALQQLKK